MNNTVSRVSPVSEKTDQYCLCGANEVHKVKIGCLQMQQKRIIFPTLHAKSAPCIHIFSQNKTCTEYMRHAINPSSSKKNVPKQKPKFVLKSSRSPQVQNGDFSMRSFQSMSSSRSVKNSKEERILRNSKQETSPESPLFSLEDGNPGNSTKIYNCGKSSLLGNSRIAKMNISDSVPTKVMRNRSVCFDPQVLVVEFFDESLPLEKWFSPAELDRFRFEAVRCAEPAQKEFSRNMLAIHGVDACSPYRQMSLNSVQNFGSFQVGRPTEEFFTNPVISCVRSFMSGEGQNRTFKRAGEERAFRSYNIMENGLMSEIRDVLILDPRQMFCALLAKTILSLLGNLYVNVVMTQSAGEACKRIDARKNAFPVANGGASQGFDLIVVEERLIISGSMNRNCSSEDVSLRCLANKSGDPKSALFEDHPAWRGQMNQRSCIKGSELIESLARGDSDPARTSRSSFFIGVSAHLEEDQERLYNAGADMVWGKPPPRVDKDMQQSLLSAILKKRGRC